MGRVKGKAREGDGGGLDVKKKVGYHEAGWKRAR